MKTKIKYAALTGAGSLQITSVDGKRVHISNPSNSGKPEVGDMVTVERGNPVKSSTLIFVENITGAEITVTTDEHGKITKVGRHVPTAPAATPAKNFAPTKAEMDKRRLQYKQTNKF